MLAPFPTKEAGFKVYKIKKTVVCPLTEFTKTTLLVIHFFFLRRAECYCLNTKVTGSAKGKERVEFFMP